MKIFLVIKIIYCDPSSESSRRDGSGEGHNLFLCRIKKKLF